MANIIAYIPSIHKGLKVGLSKNPNSSLWLISQEVASGFVPCLSREMRALHWRDAMEMINTWDIVECVGALQITDLPTCDEFLMPDEVVSRTLADELLIPIGRKVVFEDWHLRWDMAAVKRNSPVMADVEITYSTFHDMRMEMARNMAHRSPDWWRQIGAAMFVDGVCVATACNEHYPHEYEQDIAGDPRMNFDAGQIGKYLSLHAERGTITYCARNGISTRCGLLYSTVFPCEDCAREIVAAGVETVFFEEGYSALNAQEVLRSHGVRIIQVKKALVSA